MPPHDLPDEPHRQPIDSFIIGSTDFLYFVVGVAATGYASAALARWCVANWQIGSELLVFLVLVAAFVIPVASLLAVKHGRRIALMGAVLFLIGALSIGLYRFGFPSPALW